MNYSEVEFDSDYAIEGTMVHAYLSIPHESYLLEELQNDSDKFKQYIKTNLAHTLAQAIIEKGLVQFTKSSDLMGMKISCRMFLTPSDQIQTLRSTKK